MKLLRIRLHRSFLFAVLLFGISQYQCNIPERTNQTFHLEIVSFMASTDLPVPLNNGKHYDWIKLKNKGNKTIDLSDFYLSDTPKEIKKAKLDDHRLKPDAELVIYASGKKSTPNHVDFKLSKEKGAILLSHSSGQIIQDIEYKEQVKNVSYVNTDGSWKYCSTCTTSSDTLTPKFFTHLSNELTIQIDQLEDENHLVTIKPAVAGQIYFTTNGDSPLGPEAEKYESAFSAKTGTFVRAAISGDSILARKDKMAACIPKGKHTLPVLSVLTNPENLYNTEYGLFAEKNYEQTGKASERSGQIAYYRKNAAPIEEAISFKVFGRGTRKMEKKSLTILSDSKMDNHFFSSQSESKIDGFVMRANLLGKTTYRNELVKSINDSIQSTMLMQEMHPTVLYINGAYWGLYNLMERKNDQFVKRHRNQLPNDILTADRDTVKVDKGSRKEFNKLVHQLLRADPNDTTYFELFESHFDLSSFVDFWCHEIASNRLDWSNNRIWKNEENGKWFFIGHDYDLCLFTPTNNAMLNVYMNNTKNNAGGLLNHSLRNPTFRERFFARLIEFLNFAYTGPIVTQTIQELNQMLGDELEQDRAKWAKDPKVYPISGLGQMAKRLGEYPAKRKQVLFDHFFSRYGIKHFLTLQCPKPEEGNLFVNGYQCRQNFTYSNALPIKIKMEPSEGFAFEGWSEGDKLVVLKDLKRAAELKPVFTRN